MMIGKMGARGFYRAASFIPDLFSAVTDRSGAARRHKHSGRNFDGERVNFHHFALQGL